jgi:hypothetical protein
MILSHVLAGLVIIHSIFMSTWVYATANDDFATTFTNKPVTINVLANDTVNGNRGLDIVIAKYNASQKIIINENLGTLADSSFGDNLRKNSAVALGDLDRDQYVDIVLAALDGHTQIWLNNGSGGFPAPTITLPDNQNTQAIALGDLDGDGDLDIVIANGGNQPVQIWVNQLVPSATLSFISSSLNLNFPTMNNSTSITLGDLDKQNGLDIVAVGHNVAREVWLNQGDGTFNVKYLNGANNLNDAVAIGDVNGDNYLDIAIANGSDINGDQIEEIWLNQGNGDFIFGSSFGVDGNSNSSSIALGDLNEDGYLDAVITNVQQPNQIWLNNKAGVFINYEEFDGSNSDSRSVALGDLNADGHLDGVVVSSDQFEKIWINDGHAHLTSFSTSFSNNNRFVALGDINALITSAVGPDGLPVLFQKVDVSGLNIITPPQQGMLLVDLNTGYITYTPTANFEGIDKFVYEINAGERAIVTITVKRNPNPGSLDPSPNPLSASAERSSPSKMKVSIAFDGLGQGSVISTPVGIHCNRNGAVKSCAHHPTDHLFHCLCEADNQCIYEFEQPATAEVVLTPKPDPDSVFVGWGGHADCYDGRLLMAKDKQCVAFFSPLYALIVEQAGNGVGRIKSYDAALQPSGIDCGEQGGRCHERFRSETVVLLKATPTVGSYFTRWGGDCESSRNPLQVKIEKAKTCIAHFTALP